MTDNKPWELPTDQVCDDTEIDTTIEETANINVASDDTASEQETSAETFENSADSEIVETNNENSDTGYFEEAKVSVDVPSENDTFPDLDTSSGAPEENADTNAAEAKDEHGNAFIEIEANESVNEPFQCEGIDKQAASPLTDTFIDGNTESSDPESSAQDDSSSCDEPEAPLPENSESTAQEPSNPSEKTADDTWEDSETSAEAVAPMMDASEGAAVESENKSDFVTESEPSVAQSDDEDRGISASISNDPSDWADDTSADEEEPPAEKECEDAPGLCDEEDEEYELEEDIDFNQIRIKLMALQHEIQVANIPVVIVFEGWDTAGKGTLVSKLIEGLDPRGYQVYPIRKPSEEHSQFPQMHRYWISTPKQGNISIYCGSWYREVADACFENKTARKHLQQSYNHIINLESQLVCDGVIMIKFFLHIPRKEQKKRLKKLESKKNTRWRVAKEDWEQNAHYEEYLRLYDAMIARTHFDRSLWHVIRSDSKRACMKQIFDTVTESFENALAERELNQQVWDLPFLPHLDGITLQPFPQLDMFDPDQALSDPYKPAIDKAQKKLRKLQNELYRRGIPMAIGFEGWDAAGKGGAIRRLTSALDARGFDVVPIAAPTTLEKSHHYLWRFWREVPRNGHIAIFDRTWYGRVMVERIENLCTTAQWKRAYEEINRFESELVAHGVLICKFWLHIDTDTQLARFHDRESDPEKQWKITDEDWRNREKWPLYEEAVNDMLQKTNTAFAPWTVVAGNNKQYARLKVLQTVINTIETRLQNDK